MPEGGNFSREEPVIHEIRPATLADIRVLARTLRPMDRAEIEGTGLCVRHTLQWLWRESLWKRCATVDGEVAAVWGVQGSVLDMDVSPWAFTAPAIEHAKLAFYRETRREIAEILTIHRRMSCLVLDEYEGAIRFFGAMGFRFGEPETVGGAKYRRMTMERT